MQQATTARWGREPRASKGAGGEQPGAESRPGALLLRRAASYSHTAVLHVAQAQVASAVASASAIAGLMVSCTADALPDTSTLPPGPTLPAQHGRGKRNQCPKKDRGALPCLQSYSN